jgi:outer membrane biosynthesis protein TonB
MQTLTSHWEDRTGLVVAAGLHLALVGVLLLQPDRTDVIPVPEKMVVSLADEVSLESTAPDPSAVPAAAIAPQLAPEPAPVTDNAVADTAPPVREFTPAPVPAPRPRATSAPRPQPRATSAPRPQPRATGAPRPQPSRSAAPTPSRSGGGSRIGDDFLAGSSDGDRSRDTGTPAATFGAAEAASVNSAIARQLKPHWSAPQGVDAELLVTIVRFRLNRDGSLSGSPSCASQSGVTASNEAQKALHCERAIRAVQLASPFRGLPDQFYDKWKLINSRFDRRL